MIFTYDVLICIFMYYHVSLCIIVYYYVLLYTRMMLSSFNRCVKCRNMKYQV